jgi:hypothetical protein
VRRSPLVLTGTCLPLDELVWERKHGSQFLAPRDTRVAAVSPRPLLRTLALVLLLFVMAVPVEPVAAASAEVNRVVRSSDQGRGRRWETKPSATIQRRAVLRPPIRHNGPGHRLRPSISGSSIPQG